MSQEAIRRIVLRNSLFAAALMILPTIVMVVLDLFDKHTPNNICMFSLILSVGLMSGQSVFLSRALKAESNNSELDQVGE